MESSICGERAGHVWQRGNHWTLCDDFGHVGRSGSRLSASAGEGIMMGSYTTMPDTDLLLDLVHSLYVSRYGSYAYGWAESEK